MTGKTHCVNGHELTPDNLRRRGGDRAQHRECLTCYRDYMARRDRTGMPNDPEKNRVRNVRKRAERLGFTMSKTDGTLTIANNGAVVFSGPLDDTEEWVGDAFEPLSPGPAPQKLPDTWARCVAVFIAEQQAAKRSPGTIRTRVNHLMMFTRRRPDLTPMTVTRDDLVQYFSENEWSRRTAHSFRSTFRVFFRLLYELEHRPDDPARTLPAIKIPRSMPRPCPDHAVMDAYAATDDPRVLLALKLAVETGMRRMEIARVQSSDVEGREGDYSLHVVGKGGNERTVPITDELADLLLTFQTEYVFEGAAGEQLTHEYLGVLIARALPGVWTAHTLRHRFATMAYQATNDLRAVQELLGHASPVTTAIYTKVSDDSMRRAAAAARIEVGCDRRLDPFGGSREPIR